MITFEFQPQTTEKKIKSRICRFDRSIQEKSKQWIKYFSTRNLYRLTTDTNHRAVLLATWLIHFVSTSTHFNIFHSNRIEIFYHKIFNVHWFPPSCLLISIDETSDTVSIVKLKYFESSEFQINNLPIPLYLQRHCVFFWGKGKKDIFLFYKLKNLKRNACNIRWLAHYRRFVASWKSCDLWLGVQRRVNKLSVSTLSGGFHWSWPKACKK